MKIKLLSIIVVIATVILFSGGIVKADDSALIVQLQAEIAQLTAQVQALISAQQGTAQTWCHNFNTSLGFTNSGNNEIGQLHTALQKEGISYGSDTNNTYTKDTADAVVKFQQKYFITPLSGYVGPITRAKLNSLYGCTVTASPVAVKSQNIGQTYTLTYDANGGTGVVPIIETHTAGDTFSLSSTEPTTSKLSSGGCGNGTLRPLTFVGWNTLATGLGTNYLSGASYTMPATSTTLYAKWAAYSTIVYHANYGDGTVPIDSNKYNVTTSQTNIVTIGNTTNLTRAGYIFGGWSTDPSGLQCNDFSIGPAGFSPANQIGRQWTLYGSCKTVDYYAMWYPVVVFPATNSYVTVTYDGNGNTGGTVPVDSKHYRPGAVDGWHNSPGEAFTLLDNIGNLTKTGYTFVSWNVSLNFQDAGCSTTSCGHPYFYMPGDSLTTNYFAVTMYANWKPNPPYIVTFDSQSATVAANPISITVTSPDTTVVNLPTVPTKVGYTFAGWYTAVNGGGTVFDDTTSVTADITVYAKWIISTYTITYNGNGSISGYPPMNISAHNGDTIAVGSFDSLAKPAFDFVNWNTAADGSGTSYNPGSTLTVGTTNVTLYAQWAHNQMAHQVTYDGNGNTSGTVPVDPNWYAPGPAGKFTPLGVGTLSKLGYAFVGWNISQACDSGSFSPGSPSSMTPYNLTLYACWSHAAYIFTYNGNGSTGGNVPNTQYRNAGDTSTLASSNMGNLTKDGYLFNGWNAAADGSSMDSFTPGTPLPDRSLTLYAQWSTIQPSWAITYTVTYDGNGNNGGSAPVDSKQYHDGDIYTVLGQGNLTKTDYAFGGWIVNGGAEIMTPGQSDGISGSNVVLTADWYSTVTGMNAPNSNLASLVNAAAEIISEIKLMFSK